MTRGDNYTAGHQYPVSNRVPSRSTGNKRNIRKKDEYEYSLENLNNNKSEVSTKYGESE